MQTRRLDSGREVPVIPRLPRRGSAVVETNPVVAICGECEREIRQVEHRACVQHNCPCFRDGTLCVEAPA